MIEKAYCSVVMPSMTAEQYRSVDEEQLKKRISAMIIRKEGKDTWDVFENDLMMRVDDFEESDFDGDDLHTMEDLVDIIENEENHEAMAEYITLDDTNKVRRGLEIMFYFDWLAYRKSKAQNAVE